MTIRIQRVRVLLPAGSTPHAARIVRDATRRLARGVPAPGARTERRGVVHVRLAPGAPPGLVAARLAAAISAGVRAAAGGGA